MYGTQPIRTHMNLPVGFTETSVLQLWSAVLIAVISVILAIIIVVPRITGKNLSLKSFHFPSRKRSIVFSVSDKKLLV